MSPMTAAAISRARPLRYSIALGAAPWRAPIEGDEPFIRPEVGFTPAWFCTCCGVDFSHRWHLDPDYRFESHVKMSEAVRRRFPGRDIGRVDRDRPADLLSSLFGTCLVPAMFGQELRYFSDKWPAGHDTPIADDEKADSLSPVDLDRNPVFQEVLRQCDRIEVLTGSLVGSPNWQGVLNTAFRIRGQQIFLDMATAPRRAHHIFACVTNTMIAGMKRIHARQRCAGIESRFGSTANCVVNMISPEHYRTHLLPFDLKLRSEFESFGIHNCAWVVDPYLDAYATIPDLGYIDMGITSDLAKARRLFPHARRTVLYTAMDLVNKKEEEIRADFARIARDYAPCDIGLPNVDVHVPDERVTFVMDLCAQLSRDVAAGFLGSDVSPTDPQAQRPGRS